MAFTIPNEADPGITDSNQAEPDKVDIDILVAGIIGDGMISGCAVTEDSPQSNNVAVTSGVVIINGAQQWADSDDVDCTAPHGTYARFDLIVVDSAGDLTAVKGPEDGTVVFPAVPASKVAIAAVYRAANDATIADADIVDKRVFPPTAQAQTASGLWTFDAGIKLASGQAIKDSGSNTRIALSTVAGAHVSLTDDVKVAGNLSLKGSTYVAGDILRISPAAISTGSGDHIYFIGIEPVVTFAASSKTVVGIQGSPQFKFGGAYTGANIRALSFTCAVTDVGMSGVTASITDMTGVQAICTVITYSHASNVINITNMRGVEVSLSAQDAVGTVTVLKAYGVHVKEISATLDRITDYYGIRVEDALAIIDECYLLEIGPTVPYFRVLGDWSGSANETPVYIKEGASPTLKHLQTVTWSGGAAHGFSDGDLVCVLVTP